MHRALLALLLILPLACSRSRPLPQPQPSAEKPKPSKPSTSPPENRAIVRDWSMRPIPEDQVNLIVLGDWGSETGRPREVAQNLVRYVDQTGLQFNGLLSVGDNIYTKLTGVGDMQWQSMFEDMYDPAIINFPWYAVLGNHDYEQDKPRIQLEYATRNPESRWRMPAKWYRLDLPENRPLVTVLMLDSDKNKLTDKEWAAQNEWLRKELAKPRTSTWTIAAAHHPLFSNGLHGDVGLLQRDWGIPMEQASVDYYVSGHDHNMQHLEISGWNMSFIVSGGGGRPRSHMRRSRGPFAQSMYGFAHLQLFPDRAIVRIIDGKDGKLAHEFTRYPTGQRQVVLTTPSEPGDPKIKPQKPFDEGDKTVYTIPSSDPEPPPPATQPTTKPSAK